MIKNIKYSAFLKKVIGVFFTKGILFLVGMCASILSARLLGPEGRGMVGAAAAVGGIGAQMMNLGMHSAGSYMLAKDKGLLGNLVGNAIGLSAVAGVFGLCIYIFLPTIPGANSIKGAMLLLASILIPVNLYLMLQQNLLVGINAIRQYNMLDLVNGFCYPFLLTLLAFFHLVEPEFVFLATIISAVVTILFGFYFIKKQDKVKIKLDFVLFRECLPFGVRSYVACLCSYLVLRSDVLMINAMLGDLETGLYTVAVSLADIIGILPSTIGMLLFPEAAGIKSDKEKKTFVKAILKITAIMMGLLVIIAGCCSQFFITLFYGEAYKASVYVFIILMPGIFCMALQSIISNYFAARNKWTWNIITPLVGFIINLSTNAILIPKIGIIGAAVASVIAYTSMFGIMLVRFLLDKGENSEVIK